MASPSASDGAPKGQDHRTSTSRSSIYSEMATKFQNAKGLSVRHLEEITNNFSPERKIGVGGFGTVYMGVQPDGSKVAVKVLHKSTTGIDDGLFKREFQNLMRLEHRNIVRLVGYCHETQHKPALNEQRETIFYEDTCRALCLEYMPNGSLTDHISDESDGLGWPTRYKIIKGTCEGLKYLHEGFREPIYHMDLKPDNILLDENYVPKLADFGMSKLYGDEQTRVTSNCVGTWGYMPPEYIYQQVVSKKLDIFSLGVVMTKIIAGRRGNSRSVEMPSQNFIDEVNENWRNRLQEIVHNSQQLQAYCQQVNLCIAIGLSCMDMDWHKRPNIVDIIHKLNGTESVIEEFERGHQWFSQHGTMGNKSRNEATTQEEKNSTATTPTNFSLRELKEITNKFAEERILGQGTYGKFYRGVYDNGEDIAVKLLPNESSGVDAMRFEREFNTLVILNHPNIIQFIGYCNETQRQHMEYLRRNIFAERTYRLLCFENMKMGSLQKHISDEFSGLDWRTRYKIIKGASEALKYLHEGFEAPIYHLNIKPSKILLDENMMPKLAGFDWARKAKETMMTKSVFGRIGYLPPEYIRCGLISKKFDIFSLGVVITEIIAGPEGRSRSAETPYPEYIDQVLENWRNRLEAVYTSPTLDAYCEQVRTCTEIGLSCMDIDRHKRPSMVEIIDRLDMTESMIVNGN